MAGKKSKTVQLAPSQDEKIGKIEATLDFVREDLGLMRDEMKVMNQILAVNTEQLKHHIEGVKLAREQNDLLKSDVDTRMETLKLQIQANKDAAEEKFDEKIDPIQEHVTKVKTLGKVGGWLATAMLVPLLGWGVVELIKLALN